jgi:hypothetical protein
MQETCRLAANRDASDPPRKAASSMSAKQRAALAALAIFSIVLVLAAAWISSRSQVTAPTPTAESALERAARTVESAGQSSPGHRTKTRGCVTQDSLPDPACTPGEILSTDRALICSPGYASRVRDVSSSTAASVYAEYGIASHVPGQYEVDHLVSLELGGSNSIANLWPEAADARPGYREKDRVENYLHKQVCNGAISWATAQYESAHDWPSVHLAIAD